MFYPFPSTFNTIVTQSDIIQERRAALGNSISRILIITLTSPLQRYRNHYLPLILDDTYYRVRTLIDYGGLFNGTGYWLSLCPCIVPLLLGRTRVYGTVLLNLTETFTFPTLHIQRLEIARE